MRFYTVHVRRPLLDSARDVVLVREGFSWWAFLFTGLWALWNRLWLVAAAIFAVEAAITGLVATMGLTTSAELVVMLGMKVVFAYVAADLWRWTLARCGFLDGGVVSGDGELAAERRFYEHTPQAVRDLTG